MRFTTQSVFSVILILFWASGVGADVFNMGGTRNANGTWTGLASLEMVSVGDPGNIADTRYYDCGYGSVDYTYNIGKYEVTAGQYCKFLNAVAKTDTYGLYSTYMDNAVDGLGCNIKRSGSSGNYSYTVASNWANRPVNYVNWGSAARFCNWLANGQPTGAQSLSTTEDGSYYLNGATTRAALIDVTRKPNATWVIPTGDEWYKAAYYDPNKPGGAGYWDYPMKSNTLASNVLSSTGIDNANFLDYIHTGYISYTIGDPYYRTEVGAFVSSPGPYGTFDQGGNVWEWNETVLDGIEREARGGSFYSHYYSLDASGRHDYQNPVYEIHTYGFRVLQVPEPVSMMFLALGGIGIFLKKI